MTTIVSIQKENIDAETQIVTGEAGQNKQLSREFAEHHFVRHGQGVYQYCAKKHLQRYLAEFDFQYINPERLGFNDSARAIRALHDIVGKRLTYRDSPIAQSQA